MIDTIYIEREARDHPRAREILARFPAALVVPCEQYGEVFNRAGQSFRAQKRRPALVLAVKHGTRIHEAPGEYGLGGRHNYYFSHMLNCLYDCRYCFLQGAYRSAHYVLFVNFEDFFDDIVARIRNAGGGRSWFFSGYDCDSLALEPVTGFAETFVPRFASIGAWLELRTKSTQVRSLLALEPPPNVVVAFSFTTEPVARRLEHRVPDAARRIDAMARLQRAGWRVALRFDPLVWHTGHEAHLDALCRRIFDAVDADRVHSTCIGSFRMPRDYFRRLKGHYPEEPVLAAGLSECDGMVGYRPDIAAELADAARRCVRRYVSEATVYAM